MSDKPACTCSGGTRLVVACSGAADVGAAADLAARKMARDGTARMICLAAVGAGVPATLQAAKAADRLLAIDGCPTACASKVLEKAGLSGFDRLQLADLGFKKGHTPESGEAAAAAAIEGAEILA